MEFRNLGTPNTKTMTEFGLVGFQRETQHQTLNQEVLLLLASSRVLHSRDICNDPLKLWEKKTFLRNTSSYALLWGEWNSASCVCACVLSHVRLFVTPWTGARQAPLSMGFSRQEYWSGLPFPPPGDLPDPAIETRVSCIGRWILHHGAPWEANPRQMSLSFLTHSTHVLTTSS